MVPHLTTALTGPLLELERKFLASSPQIEHWLRGQWQEHTPPFYSSCDLRNSGFKLAPVDTNLYPGGFNNLNPAFLPLCVQAAMSAIEKFCPDARSLLLIPENHTRNQFYLQNVAQLVDILRQTGLNIRLGSMLPEIDKPTPIDLPNGRQLLLEPLVRTGNRLGVAGFEPCAVLLNNDLSAGIPDILKNLHDQVVLPPLHAGWAVRRKSNHFAAYDQVANDFAKEIGIDPWRINPAFSVCRSINFHERQGEECLAANVAAVLDIVRDKYKEYGINETPYVVVKEGLEVSEVLIQEGVHSFETVNDAVAEPVIYMIDRYVTGGFYRVHTGRGKDENLNAPGMHFEPLAFETGCNLPDYRCGNPDSPPNRFYAYGVVGRLACLAAAVELERTAPDDGQA